MKKSINREQNHQCGFTLVELLMAMVISTFITAALYSAYKVQQKHSGIQEQVTDMQQSLRMGMNMVVRELRLAGYDPTAKSKAGFEEIESNAIIFTADFNEDGNTNVDCDDTGENLGYSIDASEGFPVLERFSGNSLPSINTADNTISSSQPLAEYIEQLEFHYLDEAGSPTTTLKDITSIQVSMLARARYPDRTFTNSREYVPASGVAWAVTNDNYRRRLMITTVRIRNAGLAAK